MDSRYFGYLFLFLNYNRSICALELIVLAIELLKTVQLTRCVEEMSMFHMKLKNLTCLLKIGISSWEFSALRRLI